MRGKFVVIEGIDGSGKSTLAQLLVTALNKNGIGCRETFSPREEGTGAKVRAILRQEEGCPKPEALELQRLMTVDKWEHWGQIDEALTAGVWVICSRWFYSALAYGMADGVDISALRGLNQGLPKADLCIWLDLPVEVAMARLPSKKELFEQEGFLRKVVSGYGLIFVEGARYFPEVVRIDSNRPTDITLIEAWEVVCQKLLSDNEGVPAKG